MWNITHIMKQNHLDLLILTETHMKQSDYYQIDKFHFYHCADQQRNTQGDWAQTFTGVTLVIHSRMRPLLSCVQPLTGRLLRVDLHTARQPLTILGLYAPHTERPEEERADYWCLVDEAIQEIPDTHTLILTGDLNVQLEARTDDEQDIIGPYPFGRGPTHIPQDITHNRTHLLDLCREHSL